MKTIEDEWKEYLSTCYPANTPKYQVEEMKRCFFAGALVALQNKDRIAAEKECLYFLDKERDRLLRESGRGGLN